MSWPKPKFSKQHINKAGEILASENSNQNDLTWAYDVVSNWRACHGYPINTFQATLRQRLKGIDSTAIVAQRLKRTPSIIKKLQRFQSMHLARMQDIGGLRAIVKNLSSLNKLQKKYKAKKFQHELISEKNYVLSPKPDGYRSIHLVFRYKNDQASDYNGLQLELQLRTKLQHAWATAVETMGTFLGQALKSNQGDQNWLKFFEITGSAFAHLENSTLVPGYQSLSRQETFKQVATEENTLHVLNKLRGFTLAVDAVTNEKGAGKYHLVILNSENKSVTIKPYPQTKLDDAVKDYTDIEAKAKSGELIEAVLVSAGPIDLLRKAYPNYFLDTQDFINEVEKIIAEV